MNGYILLQLILMVLCCNVPYCDAAVYGESCTTNDDCTDNGVKCLTTGDNADTCGCGTGYFINGANNGCIAEVALGSSGCVTGNSASCVGNNVQCSSGTCQCVSTHYQFETSCYQKRDLGMTCNVASQCKDDVAVCSVTCQCPSTHFDTTGTDDTGGSCTEKLVLGQTCTNYRVTPGLCKDINAQCSQFSGSSTYTCQCTSTYYDDNGNSIGGSCQSKIDLGSRVCSTSFRVTDSCSDTNAECISSGKSNVCQCKSTHYDDNGSQVTGGVCRLKVDLGYVCPMDDACRTNNADCSGTCKCDSNFYDDNTDAEIGGACESRKFLGAQCWSYTPVINDQCSDLNARCSGGGTPGSCSCSTGYHQDNGICKPKKTLDEQCDPNTAGECTDINAQCLANPTTTLCTCKTGYYKFSSSAGVKSCQLVSQLRVTGIVFSSVTTSRFTVSWSPPAGKSSYVSRYTVTWRPKDNSVSGSSKDISSPTTSTTVSTGLTSGVAYTVTITSVNTGTQSGSERYTSTSKEQALVPLTPNGYNSFGSDLTVSSNNGITVRWAAPAGFVRQYVFIMKDGETEKRTLYPATAEATPYFTGMKKGYTYNIEITALSQLFDDGKDLSSETYFFTLKTTVITPSPPVNIACTETNIFDDHILLIWEEPTYPNGDLLQYIVEVFVYPQLTVHQTYTTGSKNTSYDVQSLNPGSFYTFKVKTQNEQFTSSAGSLTQQYCNTRAKMSDAPENLLTSAITSRGMKIVWDKPVHVYSAENLGYVLQIKAVANCAVEQIYRCSDCTGNFQLNALTGLCDSNYRLTETPKTKLELDTTLLFTTSALDPDTVYTVSVTTINNAGRGNAAVVTQKTLEEAPQTPTNIITSAFTSTTVDVTWSIDGPRPGVTTYTISVEPVDTPASTVTRTVPGFTNTSYKVTGLEEFWRYVVKVKVATSKGTKTSDTSSDFKTLPAAPGPVDAFTMETPDGDYTKLKISWKTPTVLERNGVIKDFKFTHNATELSGSTVELGRSETFYVESLDSHVYEKTVMVQPEDTYTFEVYAVNEDDQPGYVTSEIKMAPPGVPKNDFEDLDQKMVVPREKVAITGQTSFKIVVDSGFLAQTTYGAITLSGLLICTVCTTLEGKNSIDLDVYQTYRNYDAASGSGDPYRPTKDSWITDQTVTGRRKKAAADEIEYTVGVETCTNTGGYCNGPLKADTQYRVHVVVCTNGGCLLSNAYGPFKTEAETEIPESVNTALIVGVVMGVVVLFLIAALVICCMRNKRLKTKLNELRSNQPKSNTQENSAFDNLQEVSIPVSGDYANNYMELDDTSRVDTYDKIAIGRPDVEDSATDTEQYEIPDVPSQNRWK